MFSKDKANKPNGAGEDGATLGSLSGPRSRAGKTSMPSIVSEGLHVTGNMMSEGDVQIDGTIEGDVKGRNLTIGVNGAVIGKVMADDVTVNGSVTGEVHAQNVNITRSAKVQGDITHNVLSIEAGAEFEGRCKKGGVTSAQRTTAAQTAKSVFQQLTGANAPPAGAPKPKMAETGSTMPAKSHDKPAAAPAPKEPPRAASTGTDG